MIGFVRERRPAAAAHADEPVAGPVAEAAPAAGESGDDDAYPRRIPVPVVRPPLDWCVPTGVVLDATSRVVLLPDEGGVGAKLTARLAKLGVEVLTLDRGLDADGVEARLAEWAADGPITGVYWLAALDDEGPLADLGPDAWRDGVRLRVKLLAVAMRALAGQVAGPGTFLVSATRLGGRFGYDAAGAVAPLGGATSGFTKALARERAEATVKVVDFGPSRKTAALAGLLVDETLRDPGVVEVGYAEDRRWSVGLEVAPAEVDDARALGADSVFVVTGAAGSIVSAITGDLAAASSGTFHLLDLVAAPDPDDPDLVRFDSDRDGLKRDLAERITARGDKATPVLIERELAKLERARAARDAMRAVTDAGGTVHWHQVDLTDGDAVVAVAQSIVEHSPRVDVLLHCAGLEISHFLPDKPQREWDLVFDVKADGFFHLLHGLAGAEVGSVVVFSSIAGRFGNGGQTDYSAANDLLCKAVSSFRSTRPGTRGIAIDWTAWAEIGMAARGSIPKMMALAGIDMLPPSHGIPAVRRELTAAGAGREVVVAGRLGLLLDERHPTGGLDPASVVVPEGAGPLVGEVVAAPLHDGLVVRAELDPTAQGFLDDHRIDGTPVLPGVMGMEAFAEAAALLAPGLSVAAVEDVSFLAPFKFFRDEPRVVEVRTRLRDGGDGTLVADCTLLGTRTLPGQGEQVTAHFTGRVVLAPGAPDLGTAEVPAPPEGARITAEEVYAVYFHGRAYQVLAEAWRVGDASAGRLASDLPANHAGDDPLRVAPRLVELCFQTAGMWELGTTGRMALPTGVDRVAAAADADDAGPAVALATPLAGGGGFDVVVVADDGRVLVRLEGYRTIELPGGPDEQSLAPLRAAMS